MTRIVESEGPLLSPFELLPDCTTAHIEQNLSWLVPRFYDPATRLLVIAIQSFLIRSAGKTVLVDACSGDHKDRRRPFFHRREWGWLDKLRAAGVRPEDVDIVMCSHLHVDHVGWNTRLDDGNWVPTFPNARSSFRDENGNIGVRSREPTAWAGRVTSYPTAFCRSWRPARPS